MLPRSNVIGRVLFFIGIFLMIVHFIAGIYFGSIPYQYEQVWSTTFMWWIAGFVSGMLFIGFSEIIELLQRMLGQQKGNTVNVQEKEKPATNHIEQPVSKEEIVNELGENTTNQIYELYEMQNKRIEEIILTPFEKKILVKSVREGEFVSVIEVVSTTGNDAINSTIEKHPELKEWYKENKKN
ncbi:hypothetical protein ACERII_00305 [Evansella sp. AB-rgal1]|uniref:hypothetical protein n=1 Tax=Evansella sp. AB-rgal1 TaxID=3242696 RepID=UPI00359DC971